MFCTRATHSHRPPRIPFNSEHTNSHRHKSKSWELESIIKALRGKSSLNELARLDTCVTMVDAAAFRSNLGTAAELQERFKEEGGADEGDDRNVAPLLMSQIEFADVIGLSKCDLVSEAEASSVENALRALNPGAKVIRANRGDLPLSTILDTKLFSMDRAASSAGWLQHMRDEKVVPETVAFGIDSFVYKARTPFHPSRLYDFMTKHFMVKMTGCAPPPAEGDGSDGRDSEPPASSDARGDVTTEDKDEAVDEEITTAAAAAAVAASTAEANVREEGDEEEERELQRELAELREWESGRRQKRMLESFGTILRSKGYTWIAGRDHLVGEWSQSGAVGEFGMGGFWFAAVDKKYWPSDPEQLAMLTRDFEGDEIQDRRQEIVFIGQNMNSDAITAALDACLLTKADCPHDPSGGAPASDHSWKLGAQNLDDRFPRWI